MAEVDPLKKGRVNPGRRLVVFFQENAGNLGYRLDYFSTLYKENDTDVVAVAYRGYGASTGKPSEAGLKLDG